MHSVLIPDMDDVAAKTSTLVATITLVHNPVHVPFAFYACTLQVADSLLGSQEIVFVDTKRGLGTSIADM